MGRDRTKIRRAPGVVARDAGLSPCRLWRYWLTRTWDPRSPDLAVVGLNPSTADETEDDPTIRRCVGYAQRWGYGGLVMLNLFALRSTDPRALRREQEAHGLDWPIGPENDEAIDRETHCRDVLCAWGSWGWLQGRGSIVASRLRGFGRNLVCHLRGDLEPARYGP